MNEQISIESIVSTHDFDGKVVLKWGGNEASLLPHEARQHALRILAAAEAAESDATTFKLFVEVTQGDTQACMGLLRRKREIRHEVETLRYMNDEREMEDA